jgi:DNA polymerase
MGIQVWCDPAPSAHEMPGAEVETAQLESAAAPAQVNPTPAVSPSVAAQATPRAGEVHSSPAAQRPASDYVAEAPLSDQSLEQRQAALAQLNTRIEQCQLCELHASRAHAVSGEGDAGARLLIISDAPVSDRTQDALFDAAEKRLLQAMLQAIGLDLSQVYLTSLVKCMPPQRAPYTSEMICCDEHLSEQVKLIQPAAIMVLGEPASRQLLVSQKSLIDLRQRHHQHLGVPVYASYHPRDLLGSASHKRKVWQDLLQIKQRLTTQM